MVAESTEGGVGSRVLVIRARRDADAFLALRLPNHASTLALSVT